MSRLGGARERLRLLLFRRREEAAMDEELRFHLEMQAESYARAGMAPEEAWRRARIDFGGVEGHREALRDGRRLRLVEDLWRDAVFGVRALQRFPGTTVVVVLTLALAMGTSVTIRTLVRGLVTDPVSFPEPERLFSVDLGGAYGRLPRYADYRVWEAEVDRLATFGAYASGTATVGDGATTAYALGYRVTGGFFPALAVRPLLGRPLLPSDARPGAEPVVVLSHRTWAGPLGGDPAVVGRTVLLDGRPHQVVGVLPDGYEFPAAADLWAPLAPSAEELESLYVAPIGRLQPGATAEEVRTALVTVQRGLDLARPDTARAPGVDVLPLTGRWDENALRTAVFLEAAVLLLLAIGIANAAGLALTRATERRHEIAIRAALGAGRGRLVRQLVVESLLVSLTAGVLALLVARLLLAAVRLAPDQTWARLNLLGWSLLDLDLYAFGFALLLSAGTGIVVGLVPALRAARGDVTAGVRDGAPTATASPRQSRLLRALLAGEVALAMVLLTAAGLLTRSLFELLRADPGYRVEDVVTVRWGLVSAGGDGEASLRFQDALLDRLGGEPEVREAAVASNLPLTLSGVNTRSYTVPGLESPEGGWQAWWRSVTPGYLAALEVPLRAGRHLSAADGPGAAGAAVVSEAMATRHWGSAGEALGEALEIQGETWTVVGVVADLRGRGRPNDAVVYLSQRQAPTATGFVVARVDGEADAAAARIRAAISAVDPGAAIGASETLAHTVRESYANERTLALLVALFAAVAVAITVASLYAMVAHFVVGRRREFGVRLALGARPRRLLARAMAQGLVWVGIGTATGVALSAGVVAAVRGMVYGFDPVGPFTFVALPAGLLLLAALASYLPARRAAATDPVVALRNP